LAVVEKGDRKITIQTLEKITEILKKHQVVSLNLTLQTSIISILKKSRNTQLFWLTLVYVIIERTDKGKDRKIHQSGFKGKSFE